jgi:hypothetical protein
MAFLQRICNSVSYAFVFKITEGHTIHRSYYMKRKSHTIQKLIYKRCLDLFYVNTVPEITDTGIYSILV